MNHDQVLMVLKQAVQLNSNELDEEECPELSDKISELYAWGNPKNPEGYEITQKDNYGGEGQGDDYWIVLSVKDLAAGTETFIKFEGFYTSYSGVEWGSEKGKIVEPYQVQVTKWK